MRNRRLRPHLPWLKDERLGRLFLSMTTASAMRLLIIALAAFAAVVVVGAFFIIDQQARLGHLAKQNEATTRQLKANQARNHASRLADQARDDARIRELACAIIAPEPDTIPKVKQKRAEYHCPPYDPRVAKQYQPVTTPGSAKASTTPRHPVQTAPSSRKAPAPSASATHAHATPRPATSTTPTRTRVRTVTATPPRPAPALIPGLLCPIATLPILCPTGSP